VISQNSGGHAGNLSGWGNGVCQTAANGRKSKQLGCPRATSPSGIYFARNNLIAGLLLYRKSTTFCGVQTNQVKKCATRDLSLRTDVKGVSNMYRVSETVRTTHGQDGAIMLDIQQGQILHLNPTGSLIFMRLQQGESESQISDEIIHQFRIQPEIVHEDLIEFLQSLERRGLIHNYTVSEGL
jgi:Coenzyme PQQ synthesis protein D (PqqD)